MTKKQFNRTKKHTVSLAICMCTVRLRYRDKIAKCRFFVVPGDGPVLLGMPGIELLDILKVM